MPYNLLNSSECAVYSIMHWRHKWNCYSDITEYVSQLLLSEWWQSANDLEEWNCSFVAPHDGYISDGRRGFGESNKEMESFWEMKQ